jgi:ribulose-5-phosphate 4-epimerase/fuculose-1-phosphate aldolase
VALNTSTDGSERHFMPNCVQQRGKAASQLTLKNLHFRQSGYISARILQYILSKPDGIFKGRVSAAQGIGV